MKVGWGMKEGEKTPKQQNDVFNSDTPLTLDKKKKKLAKHTGYRLQWVKVQSEFISGSAVMET